MFPAVYLLFNENFTYFFCDFFRIHHFEGCCIDFQTKAFVLRGEHLSIIWVSLFLSMFVINKIMKNGFNFLIEFIGLLNNSMKLKLANPVYLEVYTFNGLLIIGGLYFLSPAELSICFFTLHCIFGCLFGFGFANFMFIFFSQYLVPFFLYICNKTDEKQFPEDKIQVLLSVFCCCKLCSFIKKRL
jgi:hypothetical protein